MESQFRCVNCAHPVEKLYIQYSPGNIRLSKCEVCRSISDEYIECELMIVFIDLILHKPKAYRHLLFNTLIGPPSNIHSYLNSHQRLSKLIALFFCLDACRLLVLVLNDRDRNSMDLASGFKIALDALAGNLLFLGVLGWCSRRLLNLTDGFRGYKDVILAAVVSSYFKLFTVAMLVWDFPTLVLYVVDLFVLSSNLVALQVISQDSSLGRCMAVCVTAHAAKLMFSWMINLLLL